MIPPGDRPQVWDSEVVDQWAFWSRFHVDLHPYFDAAAREYAASGMPILRHHLLTHPEDDVASALEDQFMIGPKLLAAPVLEPSATHRRLYVPAGRWVDWWTGEEIKADGWITQPVDLERFPLFQLIDQQ
jgi:alpha-glucosidase (family GH31 glycosyl hydrolase)